MLQNQDHVQKKGLYVIIKKQYICKGKILADDQDGRYIKVMLKDKNGNISRTFSCMYLEPNGDIDLINPSTFMEDISADLNNVDAIPRHEVYHMK